MSKNILITSARRVGRAKAARATGFTRSAGVLAATFALLMSFGLSAGPAGAEESAPAPTGGCAAAPAPPGRTVGQFAAAGRTGTYIRDVPPGARGPLPVVFDLHGYLEPAAIQHASSGFGDYGAVRGFVTVTPQLDQPGLPRWNFEPGSADLNWLTGLIDHIEATVCADERRLFVTGLSMGAFTTSALACHLSGRIAAIAPVAGAQDFPWCETTRPVPVIAFHGTADPIVAYTGGRGPAARLLPSPDGSGSGTGRQDGPTVNGPGPASIPDAVAGWARRNGCGAEPERAQIAADVLRESYPCPAHGDVELYSLQDGGHVWPGSSAVPFPEILVGSNTTSIDATRLIWDFFAAHPLTR